VNWLVCLQDFDFKMLHVKGNTNGHANALSRPEEETKIEPKTVTMLLKRLFTCLVTDSGHEVNDEEKERRTRLCHDSPTARHYRYKRTMDLI
jgi:hypothetical protein